MQQQRRLFGINHKTVNLKKFTLLGNIANHYQAQKIGNPDELHGELSKEILSITPFSPSKK